MYACRENILKERESNNVYKYGVNGYGNHFNIIVCINMNIGFVSVFEAAEMVYYATVCVYYILIQQQQIGYLIVHTSSPFVLHWDTS